MTAITIRLVLLLPIIILMFSLTFIMLVVAWKRIHCLTLILSILGIILSFLSLILVNKFVPSSLSTLFYFSKHSIIVISLILFASFFTCINGYIWLVDFCHNKEEFYLLVLFSTLGGILLSISNHMISVFTSLELLSLPLISLIRYLCNNKISLESVLKYTISSIVGTVLMLFGMALVYSIAGDLSFVVIKYYLGTSLFHNNVILICGLTLILISLALKLSIAPFHFWASEIYEGSPSTILIFLSTVVKIAILSVFTNLCFQLLLMSNNTFYYIMQSMICLSIIIGSVITIFQNSLKKIMGFASISQLGIMLITMFGIHNYNFSIETNMLYLIGYTLNNLCIFSAMSLTSMMYINKNRHHLSFYQGLFWKSPLIALSLTINLLSFIGFPMTIGFIGKFNLLILSIKENLTMLVISLIFGSIISIFYYIKIIIGMYFVGNNMFIISNKFNKYKTYIILFEWIILALSILTLLIGCYPEPLFTLVQNLCK